MTLPLDGIRVIDVGRYIAGPWCAALLGDLGADVIRVEAPGGGDDRWFGPVVDDGSGVTYLQVNRNKRGVTVDFRSDAGRSVLQRLVAGADVLVANLPDPVLERLGLGWTRLHADHPALILVTTNAFGSAGPWKDKTGFDGVAQSMSGAAYLAGTPDEPSKSFVPWVDFGTATNAALATVAAIRQRDTSGVGQRVQGSLLATALTLSARDVAEQAAVKPDRVADGNRSQIAGPADIVATTDGWIIAQVVSNPIWKRWCALIERPDLLQDERFATDFDRGRHRQILCGHLADWASMRSTDEALLQLEDARIPAGPVLSPQQVLDHPHVVDSGLLVDAVYDGTAILNTPFPATLSATATGIRRAAPTPGEHTADVLTEFGFTPDEIATLSREGSI